MHLYYNYPFPSHLQIGPLYGAALEEYPEASDATEYGRTDSYVSFYGNIYYTSALQAFIGCQFTFGSNARCWF